MSELIHLFTALVALWAGYEIGRSAECAEWCERQLKKLENEDGRS